MSQAPVLPMFVDAMIADTLHLDMEAFGAYHMILYATWRANGVPLPDDDIVLARVCRMAVPRWKKVRGAIVSFFDLSAGTWRQKRLDKEWNRCAEARRVAKENGARGGRPARKQTNAEPKNNPTLSDPVNPNANQTETQTKASLTLTIPINQTPPSESVAARDGDVARRVVASIAEAVGRVFGAPFAGHVQDRAIADGWLQHGLSPEGILAVIEPILSKRNRDGGDAPGSLKFFLNAMQRAIAAGAGIAKPVPLDADREAAAARFNAAFNRWADGGREGPPPTREQFGLSPRVAAA